MVHAEKRPLAHQIPGQSLDPAENRGELAAHQRALRVVFDQFRRPIEVSLRQGLSDRLRNHAILFVPPAGPVVKLRKLRPVNLFGPTAK